MKKFVCFAVAVLMMVAMVVGCSPKASNDKGAAASEIVVGMIGPYTGETAVYGLAVKNGAMLYFDQINADGGINGKQVKVVAYDNKGNDAEAVNAFSRLVDQDKITALIGDVLTSNTIAVVGEANPINMPMITASATAAAVTVNENDGSVYANVFRTCFIDPFQGEKMAAYAIEKLGAKTAAVLAKTGDAYSAGLAEAFVAKFEAMGGSVTANEGYAAGDVDFNATLTKINSTSPEVVFCPNYYEDIGKIVTQARAIGLNATFLGGDGWAGVKDYASAEDLAGSFYCSAYAPSSTDKVKEFEAAYEKAYGEPVPNMFAALAYDAAQVLCAALVKAEASGEAVGNDAYKQAVIDAIKSEGASVVGVTSANGYTFDANNNPIKDAVIMSFIDGVEAFKEMY